MTTKGAELEGIEPIWVERSSVKVPEDYYSHKIGKKKWFRKNQYFDEHGEFESKVLVDSNLNLLDGYSTICVAKKHNIQYIPVYIIPDGLIISNNREEFNR